MDSNYSLPVTKKISLLHPEQLIEEVKKHRLLWDQNLEEYLDKWAREKAWEQVLTALFPGATELPAAERIELDLGIRKKWKSIRTCYTRELMRKKTVKYKDRRRPYMYFNLLGFLELGRSKGGNENSEEPSEAAESSSNTEKPSSKPQRTRRTTEVVTTYLSSALQDLLSPSENHQQNDTENEAGKEARTHINEPISSKPAKKMPNARPIQNCSASTSFKIPRRQISQERWEIESLNSDKMFLTSLVPDMQMIDPSLKIKVKLEIMKIIMKAQEKSNSSVHFYEDSSQIQGYAEDSEHLEGNEQGPTHVEIEESNISIPFVKVESETLSSGGDPEDSMDYDDIFLV